MYEQNMFIINYTPVQGSKGQTERDSTFIL